MVKIWDRNTSKSKAIDHCGGDEKTEWPHRTDKSQTLNFLKISVNWQEDLHHKQTIVMKSISELGSLW